MRMFLKSSSGFLLSLAFLINALLDSREVSGSSDSGPGRPGYISASENSLRSTPLRSNEISMIWCRLGGEGKNSYRPPLGC